MKQLMAKVYFTKEAYEDNYFEGQQSDYRLIMEDKLEFRFTDRDDLVNQFAGYLGHNFDVNASDVRQHIEYDEYNSCFRFYQEEDECGDRKTITENDPDGYGGVYQFDVTVYEIQEVDYKF